MADVKVDKKVSGSAVMLDGELQAGFLITQASFGKESKEHVAFNVTHDSCHGTIAVFARICTSKEKNKLKKLIYGDKCVQSRRLKTNKGEDCMLLVIK